MSATLNTPSTTNNHDDTINIKLTELTELHTTLQHHIATIQSHTTQIFQQRESELLSDVMTKLRDMHNELTLERTRNRDGNSHYVTLTEQLSAANVQLQQSNTAIQTELTHARTQMKKLNAEVKRKDSDQQFLIQQIYELKKQIAEMTVERDHCRKHHAGNENAVHTANHSLTASARIK